MYTCRDEQKPLVQYMIDVLLSWKQESTFQYFSETKTSFGINTKLVLLNRIQPYSIKAILVEQRQLMCDGGMVLLNIWFLADHTNGRLLAQCCVCRRRRLRPSSVTLCIVAKRCVLEQKLLLRAYRKSYMRNRLVPK